MKRIIAVLLAVITVFAVCSCAKKDTSHVDAIMDYYVVRYSMEGFTEKSIEYVGEDEETGRKEYSIKNDELGIDTTLYTEDWGAAVNVYDKEGARVHIYNPNSSNE